MTIAEKVLLVCLSIIPQLSFAEGVVSFSEDVLPLLRGRPEMADPILREISVSEIGIARRLGPKICPALAGKRIPPYIFRARGRSSGQEFLLIVNTDVDFYDDSNHLVFGIRDGVPDENDGNLPTAVTLRESLSSLVLKVENGSARP